MLDTIYILTHNNKISEYPYRNIFFLMGLAAVTNSCNTDFLYLFKWHIIKDAGPHG